MAKYGTRPYGFPLYGVLLAVQVLVLSRDFDLDIDTRSFLLEVLFRSFDINVQEYRRRT